MANKRVLVTGSNGFIGQRLVRRLLADGFRVVGVDSFHNDSIEVPNFEKIRLDLLNENSVSQSIHGDFDYVFHLAAITRTRKSSDLMSLNRSITRNLLRACRQFNRLQKFVFVSSVAACGPQKMQRSLNEESQCRPVSNYGRSKAACEQMLLEFSDSIPVSIVRPPIVLGPGDRIGLKMFRAIQRWNVHLVAGDKQKTVGIVAVDDLVDALILVARNGDVVSRHQLPKGTYVVATVDSICYAELGRRIGELLSNRRAIVVVIPAVMLRLIGAANDLLNLINYRMAFLNSDKTKDSLAGSWSVDSSKIRRELGFSPASSGIGFLQETINWYRNRQLLQ